MRYGNHENRRLQGACRKYGPLKEEILLLCRKQDLIMYEQICIDEMRPGYNQSTIADRAEMTKETRLKLSRALTGRVRSPEHCAKISESKRGKARSPETRAKLSIAARGKTHSPETRDKISALGMGRVFTPEVREKIAAAQRGRPLSMEHRAKLKAAAIKRWHGSY